MQHRLFTVLCSLGVMAATWSCYWVRAPKPDLPTLSSGVHEEMLEVDGRERTYLLYVPRHLHAGAPLVVLLHGSKQTGASFRRATGYDFDRLADQHGFVAAYPDGFRKHWNDCRDRGRYAARRRDIDDVGFVSALIDRLVASARIDRKRVFLAGYSNGGQLAFRMASERATAVRAIAAFGANLPTEENWSCTPASKPVSALLVNGTDDRINPFSGGEVKVFGFASRGRVRSAFESAHYFAQLAGLSRYEHTSLSEPGGERIDQYQWREQGKAEVMLLAIRGGGHVVPGPRTAFPSILGRVSRTLDGPEVAWQFFARQTAR